MKTIDNYILESLCYYDQRNPNCRIDEDLLSETIQPPKPCYCENCFYGRTKLALEIIKLYSIGTIDQEILPE